MTGPAEQLSPERLAALERLVAIHTTQEGGEWQTFVALLEEAGYEIRREGVRRV